MITGEVDSWTGNILDIGPMYPLVGSEFIWFIVGLALWLLWHIWQARNESAKYQAESQQYANQQNVEKALQDTD